MENERRNTKNQQANAQSETNASPFCDIYNVWLANATKDPDIVEELLDMAGNPEKIEDAFYKDLTFGTGGLRGIIGAGTNRMNLYTVAKASQGLSNYVFKNFLAGNRRIAVSYDSRIKSDLFAKVAAGVFAANGMEVHIYPELMPTPCLSFAVRELHCATGIVITASHNPAKYNGYKVYGADGCQIGTKAADEIQEEIGQVEIFDGVKRMEFEAGIKNGRIHYISEAVTTAFVDAVKGQSLLRGEEGIDKDVAIVYSPLNGTGLRPVLRTLQESGYTNISVVKEQEQPDGTFPTCPYPNPEIDEAMGLGISYAKKCNAELFLATDPDCDRVGIAVKSSAHDYRLMSGNETGMLLLDYICARRKELGTMPANPVMMKTIVSTDMAERIAESYGVKTINVLTGFKFIGEQIGFLEMEKRADSFVFGFEESYGYLSGTYVRDKDAVNGVFLICEMFAYYKSKGIGLCDKLKELYDKFGFCLNTLHSYVFEGVEGFWKMGSIMAGFRKGIGELGGKRVWKCLDYSQGLDGLPKSDVLKFFLEGDCSVVIRPSGTEPKLKVYVSVCAGDRAAAEVVGRGIVAGLEARLDSSCK